MIKLTICDWHVFATVEQIEALNTLLSQMTPAKECRNGDNWDYVPDKDGKRYKIVTQTTIKLKAI